MLFAPNLFKNKLNAFMLLVAISTGQGAWASESADKPSQAKPAMAQMPLPKVSVVQPRFQTVPVEVEVMGRVVAKDLAEIRPQVSGIILSKHFDEGARVEQGQLLYQIDDESYRAAYESALASVSSAQSTLENATLTVKRNKRIVKINAISEQDVDNAVAAENTAKAQVLVAQATLKNADINLKRTQIRAPISGIIGRSLVMPGALVSANQAEALALVQDLKQIYVDFAAPSSAALALQAQFQKKQLWPEVKLLSTATSSTVSGQVVMVDQAVNVAKDTVVVRVLFDNKTAQLLPGLFVRGQLPLGEKNGVMLLPPQALSRDVTGQARVMLVGAENKVRPQAVKDAGLYQGQWVITQGLKEGDSVITQGLQTLRPGSEVQIVPLKGDKADKPVSQNGATS